MRSSSGRHGGWPTTSSSARSTTSRAGSYWREWPEGLRDRDPSTLGRAREQLSGRCRYYAYVQWIAGAQWTEARRACGSLGIVGDFPFMVNGHSADVWARQGEFHLDASVGVPVAQGSDEEQDWGLPPYRWDVIRASGYQWLRERTRRCAELFDAFRVDHLVGFYRTYARDRQKHGFFSPPDEPSQIAQGEAVMALFRSLGSLIIAEDLGVVPDFVRASQGRLEVPGLRVLRWERQWAVPGQPFLDPAGYPARSVAISGTHDTDTMAGWWDGASLEERRAAAELPILRDAGVRAEDPYGSLTRDALLATLFHSASDSDAARAPGRVRLAGSDQYTLARQRRQLVLAPAVPGRIARLRLRRDGALRLSPRAQHGVWPDAVHSGLTRASLTRPRPHLTGHSALSVRAVFR